MTNEASRTGTAQTGTASGAPDPRRGRTSLELHVADVERSLSFYGTLGFQVARRWKDWIRLDRDGAELVLFGDAYVRGRDHYFTPYIDRTPRGVGVEVIVEVADIETLEAVHAAAVAAALHIVRPPQDRDWKARDFRLADPDGYFIRITSPLRHD